MAATRRWDSSRPNAVAWPGLVLDHAPERADPVWSGEGAGKRDAAVDLPAVGQRVDVAIGRDAIAVAKASRDPFYPERTPPKRQAAAGASNTYDLVARLTTPELVVTPIDSLSRLPAESKALTCQAASTRKRRAC